MAKKHQIILTHGSAIPSTDVVNDLHLGEVLVQHAADAKDAALHTVIKEGEVNKLVSFPSKEWVTAEVAAVNAEGINKTVAALQEQVDGINTAYQAADKAEKEEREAAVEQLQKDYKQADADLEEALTAAFEGADASLQASIDALVERADKIEDTAADNLDAAKAYADEKVKGLAEGAVAANTAAIAKEVQDRTTAVSDEAKARVAADEALQTAVDSKVAQATYDAKVEEIEGDIDALESVLEGYSGQGAVKAAVDSKVAQTTYDAKVGEINGKLNGLQDQIDALGDTYYTEEEINAKVATINADIAKAKTTLTTATPAEGINVVQDATDPNNYTITAKGLVTDTAMNAVKERLDIIEGDVEVNGSMKNIAAAEVAKVVDNSPEAFDTLREIAEWIGSDTTGAAGMATDIANLKATLVDFDETNTVKKTTDAITDRVGAIEEDYLTSTDKSALELSISNEANAREAADKAIDDKLGAEFSATNTVANAIAAEADARVKGDAALQSQIEALGNTYYTETEIDAKIATINADIAKAKTTLTEANPEVGVKVVKNTTDPNKYTITAEGLAAASTVTALEGRVTTAEGAIQTLVAEDVNIRKEITDGDTAVRNAFAEADTALKAELNTEIGKKADITTVNGLDTRLGNVEDTYVSKITYKDATGKVVELTAVDNVIDLSGMVIDGGEY